ncbi:MAG: hypothetical protein E7352_01685 [Clostridiales bacterium]|nr:hypothetical protein [Clostridiales bacterium]
MAKSNSKFKFYAKYVWQLIKDSLPSGIMYLCAGCILMMATIKMREDNAFTFKNAALFWIIFCPVVAAAYNALMSWANGGQQYEMLVSGNIRRSTEQTYGAGYKIGKYKEEKEYRIWKGFVVGGLMAFFAILVGIVWGVKQSRIDARLADMEIGLSETLGIILSGWSVMPIYYANAMGANISYFVSLVFALVPIGVTAGFYIWGAYARRNKRLREQAIADRASQSNKPQKINYGGLPGTKPKKKK